MDEITLFSLCAIVVKWKRMIICSVATATAIATIVSFFFPKFYLAEAVIMPIGKGTSRGALASLAGQFGDITALVGGAEDRASVQQLMAILKSRTLVEEMIRKYELFPEIHKSMSGENSAFYEMAVERLQKSHVRFIDDKKMGVIRVSAEFKDPQLAADVANGYITGLQSFINGNAFTVAKRNRIFIERQLAQNKAELLEAGKELNEFYREGKVSSVESKLDVPIDDFVSSDASMDVQLTQLEKKKEKVESVFLAEGMVKNVPQQVYLQYMTLRRDLLTQINTLLTQQYEMAKIEEAKDELSFQIIDPAKVPQRFSKPKKQLIVMSTFAVSLVLNVLVAFFLEYFQKLKKQV